MDRYLDLEVPEVLVELVPAVLVGPELPPVLLVLVGPVLPGLLLLLASSVPPVA